MAGLDGKCARRAKRRRCGTGRGSAAYFEALEERRLFAAGLVGAWSFDEGTGTTAADASGTGNNGVISNATWVTTGKYGNALSFNGANSYVTINDSASLHLTTGMTLEAWVSAKSLSGFETAVLKERPSGLSYALYTSNNSSKPPATYINTGGSDISQPAASNLVLNTWTFLTATYNGSKLDIYVNGVLSKSKNVTGNIITSSGALRIGGNSVWGEYFNGLIDNVRVYNRALSAAEVQTDMTTPVGDTTPPTVTGMSPASGATNVALGTTITATFSEAVQSGTPVFSVKDVSNNVVAGTTTYPDATHATFTPSTPLAAGTLYTVSVSGATDTAGNAMTTPVSWSFTTTTPDTTPPTVTVMSPASGATNVAQGTTITATFSESVQSGTPVFNVTDALNNVVPGTTTYPDATHATFTPNAALSGSTQYTVSMSGAKDLAGNTMTSPATWSFTTAAPDTTPPTVSVMSPAAGAINVALATTITATFSEPVQSGTAVFNITDASNNVVAGATTYPDSTHATFTPSASLSPTMQYTVNVSGAKDLAGNTMASPATWAFTTATPPVVLSTTPADGATNVLLGATLMATFNEAIQPATMSFVLHDDKSNPIAGTVTYNSANSTATFTPTVALVNGMTYTAIVSGAADLSGNVMDHVHWMFVTVPLGTGPYSIFKPTDAPAIATDPDPTSTEVGVKFRSDVGGYITGIRFYKGSTNTGVHVGDLWTSTGTKLATATFSGETATGWQQVNFAQPVAVQANTTYVASYHTNVGHYAEDDNYFASAGKDNAPLHALKAGVDGSNGVYINGPAGTFPTQNWLSANYWVDVVFTSASVLGPQVTTQTPAPGATNVAASTTVTATFNESVQAGTISFVLRDAANNSVAGTAVYSDTTHTVTFVPNAALNPSTTYTAVVSGAKDSGGTVMASPASWSFTTAAPAADPSVVGQWSSVMNWGLVAINQVLLKDGRILMWDGGPACIGSSSATVYNPADGSFTPVPVDNSKDDNDIFCSGAVVMADGRVAVVGGHDCTGVNTGIKSLNIFNPVTMTWTRGPNMNYARWYPTATLLPDGRVLVTAGADKTDLTLVPIPEVYDPVANTWTKLTAASQTINNYPFMYVLPNGNVLEAGSDEAPQVTRELNVATQTWTTIDPTLDDGSSSVMYRPGQILKAGASCPEEGDVLNNPSSASAYTLNMNLPTPQWQATQSMANARTWLDLTMLPDGNVLATGGSRDLGGVNPANAVLPAEIWNPNTGTWTTVASMATPRMYHSTALLLPDGRILVAGGGHNYVNNNDFYSAEYYSPAYLFKGARPTITSVASTLQYNNSFFVQTPDGASIASVALIRNGAVTHAFDEDQRYIPLSYTQTAGGLTVQAPADANTAPPGTYMLFIVNSNGVPCVAPFVSFAVPSVDVTPPSAPGLPVATGGMGSMSLTWAPSTDNVGVVGYNVYRSTVSGFTPAPANLVGQPATASYSENIAAGTYYYVVKARDAAGNLSASSGQVTGISLASSIKMIQHAAAGNESNLAQLSLAFPANVTAGDFLIITGTAARPRSTITITDTAGNTFVPAISAVSDAAQDVTAYVWYVVNAKGGADSITLTPTGGPDALEIHVSEWSGINQSNPLDQISTAAGAGTQISSGAATTTQNGELIYGYTFPNQNSTAGAGFTGLSLINGDLDEYQIQNTAGSIAATFTQQSDNWFALMATFRPITADSQPPTAPGNPVATGAIGSVSLAWDVSTDNVGVIGYNVYRSTVSGFTPSAANLVAQPTTNSYVDTVAAGTYYYVILARDAGGNLSAPSTQVSATATTDTVSPTVSVSAPANGATVSGSITVSAIANDNVGVVGVQFLLDGNALGVEDTTSPYSISWATTGTTNGSHTLTARARDAAGNLTVSAPITVTVNNVAATGLVASYNFDQGSGTTLNDTSGNNLNGTIANATWSTSGHTGDALSFNGTNSMVTIADNNLLDLTTGMTLEAWVKPTTMSGYNTIILKERPSGLAYALYGEDGSGVPPVGYVNISGTDRNAVGTSNLTLNTWVHLATTYDGKTLRMYVNGVQVGSRTIAGSITTSTGALRIGGNSVWGEYFNGLIDDVRIYNKALTAAQIQTDMNTPVN